MLSILWVGSPVVWETPAAATKVTQHRCRACAVKLVNRCLRCSIRPHVVALLPFQILNNSNSNSNLHSLPRKLWERGGSGCRVTRRKACIKLTKGFRPVWFSSVFGTWVGAQFGEILFSTK